MSPDVIKLCGFTDPTQAADAVHAGATHLGAVLWAGSKRAVDEARMAEVFGAAHAAGAVVCVAVVVDHPAPATLRALGADLVQLHGDESPAVGAALRAAGVPFWRALRVPPSATVESALAAVLAEAARWPHADAFVLDAHVPGLPGGTGKRVDLALAAAVAARHRVVLAGGLGPASVAAAIAAVAPLGVDVASGIERSPGDKDPSRVTDFVAHARDALAAVRQTPPSEETQP